MFKIESYVTPILLSYVDKYVKNFRPADAQVSLWSGGVALHNLIIKTDVLQQEVSLPFTLVSGRIHELFIQVPWMKIMSEPIVVNMDTMECILSMRLPSHENDRSSVKSPSPKLQDIETPPGYMQALVRRIVSNISVTIHHLIIKYVQDDVIISLNVKHLSVESAGPNWKPAFADFDIIKPAVRRLIVLDDLTLCLDRCDSEGNIRFYQDPILYRCRLELRVLIKLLSVNTRRAGEIRLELRSNKLAWAVTNEQMLLLIRLFNARGETPVPNRVKVIKEPLASVSQHRNAYTSYLNQAEPGSESWSAWAWSWVPQLKPDNERDIEEESTPTLPLPIAIAAYLDDISLSIKLMEVEASGRKRSRSILEIHAMQAALKLKMCIPTLMSFKLGIRELNIKSFGKCVCGHLDYNAIFDEPTIYLLNRTQHTGHWEWPDDNLEETKKTEKDVKKIEVNTKTSEPKRSIDLGRRESKAGQPGPVNHKERASHFQSLLDFEVLSNPQASQSKEDDNSMWKQMEPVIFLDYTLQRSPPDMYTNPYENPPSDFEYSDWEEECNVCVQIEPIDIRFCMGLIHRMKAIQNCLASVPDKLSGPGMRVLTMEECDALLLNLPQQRLSMEIKDLRIRLHPSDHYPTTRPLKTPLVLDVSLPKGNAIVTWPMYSNRVCSAAGQMPEDSGPIWRASRIHLTAVFNSIQVSISSLKEHLPKPCVRAEMRFVVHLLQHPEYFEKKRSVLYSYALKIREANVSGSAARLHAANQILISVVHQKISPTLLQTTLAQDALNDEGHVAIDVTLEELSVRGYITKKVMTHICQLQAIRATVIQAIDVKEVNQAWVFSGPDVPINTAFFRMSVQWCSDPFPGSMDYLGIWSEPTALSIDPLFVSWCSYRPLIDTSVPLFETVPATAYMSRRRTRPPIEPTQSWWKGENLIQVHERLKKVFVSLELGLVLVYITTKTASAVNCATVRLAMERHVINNQGVLVFSVGRWSMYTSTVTKSLWYFIDHEGPTYVDLQDDRKEMLKQESFPWKMILADISCYALESNLRGRFGQLKVKDAVNPRTILELISTTIILTVERKSVQHIIVIKKTEKQHTTYREDITNKEKKLKYFTAGADFMPASLKDFLRGPQRRLQDLMAESAPSKPVEADMSAPIHKTATGATVSLGFNLHADTPPVVVRVEHDQIHLVLSTLHCLSHVMELLKLDLLAVSEKSPVVLGMASPKPANRSSLSEIDELSLTESSRSETRSDLMTIFEAHPDYDDHIKTFIWFQWVIGRTTLVTSTEQVKWALDIDDIIITIDLQEHYNQVKIKMASAFMKQYERTEYGQWASDVLGGRVLEALEPANADETGNFLVVTITQAKISDLPASWKDELHPKLLEQIKISDTMWEIFATLAPLEIVILPAMMDNVMSVVNAMARRSYCQSIANESDAVMNLPYVYFNAGGVRLLLNCGISDANSDDTFILSIGRISINPHPEHPVCRRPVVSEESGWNTWTGNFEGRQYELFIKCASIRTARLAQLISEEESAADCINCISRENPAYKWRQAVIPPILTPVLHPLDINAVLAPALLVGGVMTCGPAVEFNLTSDCAVEMNVDQLSLAFCMQQSLHHSYQKRVLIGTDVFNVGVCPYADILGNRPSLFQDTSAANLDTDDSKIKIGVAPTLDSGVEAATTHSTFKSGSQKESKSYSGSFVERTFKTSDHIEVFITMGVIEFSLYTIDDGSSIMDTLKPASLFDAVSSTPTPSQAEDALQKARCSRSLTEIVRKADNGVTQMNLSDTRMVRKNKGNIPLCHMTLHQPNVYYWKRRSQKKLQLSLFNIWMGFGMGLVENYWYASLLSTAKGESDPLTDIPPALATMKYSSAGNVLNSLTTTDTKGNMQLDIERPILIEMSADSIRRLVGISNLLKLRLTQIQRARECEYASLPLLFRVRRSIERYSIDAATINISQVGLTGFDFTTGWDSVSLQMAWNALHERLIVRGLVNSLLVSAGSFNEPRQPILQPLQLGIQMKAVWEPWRHAKGALTAKEPTVRFNVDVDHVIFDVRPKNTAAALNLLCSIVAIMNAQKTNELPQSSSSDSIHQTLRDLEQSTSTIDGSHMTFPSGIKSGHHFYKDDLRSGAFKIVSGGQLPMVYQVTLNRNIVSWCYPHPRAITRLVAFPLPNQNEKIYGVLEFYNITLLEWEPLTYIQFPVSEPREHVLLAHPQEAAFSSTWRFRTCAEFEVKAPFVFDMTKFQTMAGSSSTDPEPETEGETEEHEGNTVTAEQLSRVLRVDSYFAPHLTPRTSMCLRFKRIQFNAHNSLPLIQSEESSFEGYYVSKQLMRAHRVLTITAEEITAQAALNSEAGNILLLEAKLSSDILDCTNGTMERMIDYFRIQIGLSFLRFPLNMSSCSLRCCSTIMHITLHVPRLRTLLSLRDDWVSVFEKGTSFDNSSQSYKGYTKNDYSNETTTILEGRVSLWIHNSCSVSLCVGQYNTEEAILLAPGVRLAYRWRHPSAVKRMRIALGNTTDMQWSNSVPFSIGEYRVRLKQEDPNKVPNSGHFLTINVKQVGAHREMCLSGQLLLANMLRLKLLFKVREYIKQNNQWENKLLGELKSEAIGQSIVCSTNSKLVLKIKFVNQNTGWSGDIPLTECPRENVPWLVKVPSEGDVSYISVWCRVLQACGDGRIFAIIWPLYVLRSDLTLDTDVLVSTEMGSMSSESTCEFAQAAPIIQSTPGRGTSTHLLAPGTTSAKHTLSFQYRNIDCPVTCDVVPLHYGVTDTSVFDNHAQVNSVDEILKDINNWLERSREDALSAWPYSIVTRHWSAQWKSTLLQPRFEVKVRYQAVHAGGSCSLEIKLSPIVLMCNASPIILTLRAYDGTPMCKIEPGSVISPPTDILKKPFCMSIESGRETFISNQLEVSSEVLGRLKILSSGQVGIEYPVTFSIQCNQKVTLVNLHYEVKEDINVLGITPAFVFVNKLNIDVLISAIVVPNDLNEDVVLHPKSFKGVPPTKSESVEGTPLCRFWLRECWRGGVASDLKIFLCIALPRDNRNYDDGLHPSFPVRLGLGTERKSITLLNSDKESIAVVVTQHKHEGRWIVTVAKDPCPQFVVHNQTTAVIAVAQPKTDQFEKNRVEIVQDCPGVQWCMMLEPEVVTHYSTPGYCIRDPLPPEVPMLVPFLTFAKIKDQDDTDHLWCPPVAVAEGEQLIQLTLNLTIKMRVQTCPHSSLIVLRDVDQNDIVASVIRRHLFDCYPSFAAISETSLTINKRNLQHNTKTKDPAIERSEAHEKSFGPPLVLQNMSTLTIAKQNSAADLSSTLIQEDPTGWYPSNYQKPERIHCALAGLIVEIAGANDIRPLLVLHIDRVTLVISSIYKKLKTKVSIADMQIDNLQHDSGQFDFAVIASTRAEPLVPDQWPTIWSIFTDNTMFTNHEIARFVVKTCHDSWNVANFSFTELTEIDVQAGPIALYIEDAYVTALTELLRLLTPTSKASEDAVMLSEADLLRTPLRLRMLYIRPIDITLTLHTAVRMYIALDQSPVHLGALRLHYMFTTTERLAHALTVHYLSAAILGAGWVIGGLELLGAPGALAARIRDATGGVRGIASAAAAALLRSLSAWAGSLARNLDLLPGDEEHAKRAAAARRYPPDSFVAGIFAGITNFAINLLGAVSGLAHHPIVRVAQGEAESCAAPLRRGLLGALTKPLSATADLVAYAGQGLLKQTGWDSVPQPWALFPRGEIPPYDWTRECVRWLFRLPQLFTISGYKVFLDDRLVQILLTHEYLVVADPDTEEVVETIGFRYCNVGSFDGTIIQLYIAEPNAGLMPRTVVQNHGTNDNYEDAVGWAQRHGRPMVNPSFEFEPGEFTPSSLSPVRDEKKRTSADMGIFLVNMKEKDMQEIEEYEPYDNRVVDHPTTNTETLLHLLKGSLGTGILAMPKAFSNAGYVVGSIGTVVIGMLCTYCIHVLIDSCYVLCKRRKVPSLTYTAAAEAALSEGPDWCKVCAPYAAHVVNAFLLIYQIGTCCVYVVFIADNIHYVLTKYYSLDVTVFQVMCCILFPLILINWVRDLKYLAPFSAIANAVTVVCFGIILYYIFREPPTFTGKTPVGEFTKFPLFFGTVLFALEAIGVILPLENEMKTPNDFVGNFGVLNRAMISIIILYVGMGLFGYLQYGDESKGSITLNLPSDTEILAGVVQCLLAFAIFITHGLACYVAIDISWNEYIGVRLLNSKHRMIWEYSLRTLIVFLTFGIAAAVPELDLFISLFGALCLSTLGLVFPALIQTCTYWYYVSRSERLRMLIKNAIVVLFGVLGLVVGTWTSLEGIITKFSGVTYEALVHPTSTSKSTIFSNTTMP